MYHNAFEYSKLNPAEIKENVKQNPHVTNIKLTLKDVH